MNATSPSPRKLRVATVSLAGCFGCHMSLLDIDERLFDLVERVDFDRSPLTDIKTVGEHDRCDIGLVEGGLCNAENVEVLNPERPVDASHPDVLFEPNRCILCQLCVRASDEIDGKRVFAIGGHGIATRLLIDSPSGRLGDSALSVDDRAAHICPVGALLPKRVGFAVPIGQRRFDTEDTRG